MKTRISQALAVWLAAVALLTAPAPAARAQEAAPAMIVSLASADEILGDIKYITRIAGAQDAGGLVTFMAAPYTQHLESTKPAGVAVRFRGAEPIVTGFLPVKNLDGMLQLLEEQIGKPEDVGNGVKKMGLDQPIFFRPDGQWVFVSNSEAGTTPIPDPGALVKDLVDKYDVGVRVNFPAIPEPLRQMAMSEMRNAFELQLEAQGGGEDAEAQRKVAEQAMEQMERAFKEIEEITFGLAIDQEKSNVHLDMMLSAQQGSKLAEQIAASASVSTTHAGFLQPNAAMKMHFVSKMTEEEITQATTWLSAMEKQAAAELDKDDSLDTPEKKQAVKKVLSSLMGVLEKTIETGKLDGGAVLTLDNGVNFVAGGHVADGNQVAEAFKELVELAKNEPDFPEVTFNAGQHAGITFHTMSMDIPEGEDEARKALGDSVQVVLGTGENAAYLAFGKSPMELTKKVIDDSAAAGAKQTDPVTMIVSMTPIMKFAASMDPSNPQMSGLVEALEATQGRDQVSIIAKVTDRTLHYSLKVDEGVVAMIGKAASGGDEEGADGF